MIRRYYLAPNATEEFPPDAPGGHYSIAEIVLKRAGVPLGNADDAYGAMWALGFIRIVVNDEKVTAERYVDGRPTRAAELTEEQRRYFQRMQMEGKLVILNGMKLAGL